MLCGFLGRLRLVDDNGFSLLEMVVAMSVLLILTAANVPVMWGSVESAREDAVEEAAGRVMDRAFEWFYDGDVLTDPVFAGEVFVESSDGRVDAEVVVDGECVRVRAWDKFEHEAVRELCVDPGLLDPETGEVRVRDGSDSGVVGGDSV